MRKTLIVLPVILIDQWAEQIYRITGHKVLIYHGSEKKRITLNTLENSVIVLTSYQTLIPRKKGDCLLSSVHWNRLIFDEAHHLRNVKTKLFLSCYSLQSRICWLMTGTPIQNREKDFYHLCLILRIPKDVVKECIGLVKERFLLRRTKKEVGLSLSGLTFCKEKVNWSTWKEMAFSQSLHSCFRFLDFPNGEKKLGEEEEIEEVYRSISMMPLISSAFDQEGKGKLLRLLTASKQTCILPGLVRPTLKRFVSNGVLADLDEEMISSTSKLNVVVKSILDKRENGNGKLVFCHYHLEMMFLYRSLLKAGMNVMIYGSLPKALKYDGAVLGKRNLNDLDMDVVIIQIQTGCEGLNLQKYNEVYFVSPHWNPMVEEQAVARCHRLGQSKPVFVTHFVMDGFAEKDSELLSLDTYILNTQERKRHLIAGFL